MLQPSSTRFPACRDSDRHARPRPEHPACPNRSRRRLRQADHGRWRSARRDPEHLRHRPRRRRVLSDAASSTTSRLWTRNPLEATGGLAWARRGSRTRDRRDDRRAGTGSTALDPDRYRSSISDAARRRPPHPGRCPAFRCPIRHRSSRTLPFGRRSTGRADTSPAPVAAGGASGLRRGDADLLRSRRLFDRRAREGLAAVHQPVPDAHSA